MHIISQHRMLLYSWYIAIVIAILQFAVTVTVVASATNIKRIEWLSAGMTQDVGQECSRVNAHKVC